MTSSVSRRRFIATAPALWMVTASHPMTVELFWADVVQAARGRASTDDGVISDEFPRQDPQLVNEMVGVSHGNLGRVRELVTAKPALAKAAWDWGFGDWETALGAAAHTGSRDIADLLLEHGARPTIFSAAMLGQLDVVNAFVEASPGIQRTHGPHNITLLAHARVGGDVARPVLTYLESLGDADIGPTSVTLAPDELQTYVGTYTFDSGASDRLEVSERNGRLRILRIGGDARGLVPLGDHEFHPLGAPAVRIRFAFDTDQAMLTVHDPDVIVTGTRSE